MRAALSLALTLSGCLISERSLPCLDSDRCEPPYVTAPFVLGKPDGDSNAYTHGLRSPIGVTVIDGMLYVADSGNDRILIWKTWPSRNNQPPDLVIGQKQLGLLEASSMSNSLRVPRSVSGDSKRLFVGTGLYMFGSPSESNRLLMFHLPLVQNGPSYVVGRNVGQTPGNASASNFNLPSPLLVGDTLIVADQLFNRALRWTAAASFASSDANSVLGQMNFSSTGSVNPAVSTSLNAPSGSPASDGTRLFMIDTGNNRALIWNSLVGLTTNNVPANHVLGQADFAGSDRNRGGSPGLNTLASPLGIAASAAAGSTRIAIADSGNHRVLLWDSLPSMSGVAATRVLGQVDGLGASANAGGISLSSLSNPSGVYTDGTRIAVADTNNHRLLLWNGWPTAHGQPADVVVGQVSGSLGRENGQYPSPTSFSNPTSISRVGEGLAIVDRSFARVLIWPRLPLRESDAPSLVLGQSDFESSLLYGGASGTSADGFSSLIAVASDGQALIVVDGFSSRGRILLWRSLPTRNKQPADVVLLKPGFTDDVGTNQTRNDSGSLAGAALHGGRIYSVDSTYHRVLIWRSLPTQNNQLADVVLGQPDLNSGAANRGGAVGAATLSGPRGIFVDDGHIYVADTANHRILVWNTNEPTSGQPADAVIGQPSPGESQGCVSGRLCSPQGFAALGNRIYIVENQNSRVLSFGSRLPAAGDVPDRIYGQPDLTTTTANLGRLAIDRLYTPQGIVATDRGLYITDTGNGRVVVLPPSVP